MIGTPCEVPLPRKMNENAALNVHRQYHTRKIRRMKMQFGK
jgi:hypothetical protein